MSKVKIKLNHAGMKDMLRSEGVKGALHEKAEEIANKAGAGYEAHSSIGHSRALANVYAETEEAMKDNADNNTLLKAVGR